MIETHLDLGGLSTAVALLQCNLLLNLRSWPPVPAAEINHEKSF